MGTYREWLSHPSSTESDKVKEFLILCDREDHKGEIVVVCAFGWSWGEEGKTLMIEIAPYDPLPPYGDPFVEEVLLDNHLIQREFLTPERHSRFMRQGRIRFRYTLACKCKFRVPIRTEKLEGKIAEEILAGRRVASLQSLILLS